MAGLFFSLRSAGRERRGQLWVKNQNAFKKHRCPADTAADGNQNHIFTAQKHVKRFTGDLLLIFTLGQSDLVLL